jgi:hypothetical protein
MNITLTLIKTTPSSNGGFINSWSVDQVVETPLGRVTKKAHYCTKSINQLPIDTKAVIDMAQWTVQESEPFTGSDGQEHTTKWLRLK